MFDPKLNRRSADDTPSKLEVARQALLVRGIEDEIRIGTQEIDRLGREPREDATTLMVGVCRGIDRADGPDLLTRRAEAPPHERSEADDLVVRIRYEHQRTAKRILEVLPSEELCCSPAEWPRTQRRTKQAQYGVFVRRFEWTDSVRDRARRSHGRSSVRRY